MKSILTVSGNRMRKPRITYLDVWANDERIGTLEKGAMYRFTYDNPNSSLLGLHHQDRSKVYISNNMPHIFAQYFPEGFLAAHITSKYAFHDDDTLALNLTNHGKKTYPSKNTLLDFAEKYCDLGRDEATCMIDAIKAAKEQVFAKYSDVLRDNGWLAQQWHFVPDENEEDMLFTFR